MECIKWQEIQLGLQLSAFFYPKKFKSQEYGVLVLYQYEWVISSVLKYYMILKSLNETMVGIVDSSELQVEV